MKPVLWLPSCQLIENTILLKVPSLIFITIFFSIWPKGLSLPLPFWFSAAFDTIDHTILLGRLNIFYGISGLALGWFKSYLSGRTHSVKVGSTLTSCCAPVWSPPGLRSWFNSFPLYTNPISSLVHSHTSINYPFHINNTQSYITLAIKFLSLYKTA